MSSVKYFVEFQSLDPKLISTLGYVDVNYLEEDYLD